VAGDRPRDVRLGRTLAQFEKERLVILLEAHAWNTTATARSTGLTVDAIREGMKRHGLQRPRRPRKSRSRRGPRATEFRKIADWTWEAVPP
jgi:DNA-binding NtrC family response regulator